MADQVSSKVRRRVKSSANPRGLDVKDIQLEARDADGETYRIVIDDPDAEEGDNPAFFLTRPGTQGGWEMFSDRLEQYMDKVYARITGNDPEDAVDQELQEIDEQLAEAGHPAATGEEVEHDINPTPSLDGIHGGYDDGDVRVESITEAEIPDNAVPGGQQQSPTQGQPEIPETSSGSGGPESETKTADEAHNTQNDTDDGTTIGEMAQPYPDGVFGEIAETAVDASELAEKGHDRAVEAMLEEIEEMVEDELNGGDE